jgi:hypothetical protein
MVVYWDLPGLHALGFLQIDKPIPDLIPFQGKQFPAPHAGIDRNFNNRLEMIAACINEFINLILRGESQPLVVFLEHQPLTFLEGKRLKAMESALSTLEEKGIDIQAIRDEVEQIMIRLSRLSLHKLSKGSGTPQRRA